MYLRDCRPLILDSKSHLSSNSQLHSMLHTIILALVSPMTLPYGNVMKTIIVELTDKDGKLLDIREIKFKTEEGCIYCPAGVCSCSVSIMIVFRAFAMACHSLC